MMHPRVKILRTPRMGEAVLVRLVTSGDYSLFECCSADKKEALATSDSSRALASWAFDCGANSVRFAYDMSKEER